MPGGWCFADGSGATFAAGVLDELIAAIRLCEGKEVKMKSVDFV
jgi:hypothetical protein